MQWLNLFNDGSESKVADSKYSTLILEVVDICVICTVKMERGRNLSEMQTSHNMWKEQQY